MGSYWDALGADGFVKAVFRGVAQIWLCNHYGAWRVVISPAFLALPVPLIRLHVSAQCLAWWLCVP